MEAARAVATICSSAGIASLNGDRRTGNGQRKFSFVHFNQTALPVVRNSRKLKSTCLLRSGCAMIASPNDTTLLPPALAVLRCHKGGRFAAASRGSTVVVSASAQSPPSIATSDTDSSAASPSSETANGSTVAQPPAQPARPQPPQLSRPTLQVRAPPPPIAPKPPAPIPQPVNGARFDNRNANRDRFERNQAGREENAALLRGALEKAARARGNSVGSNKSVWVPAHKRADNGLNGASTAVTATPEAVVTTPSAVVPAAAAASAVVASPAEPAVSESSSLETQTLLTAAEPSVVDEEETGAQLEPASPSEEASGEGSESDSAAAAASADSASPPVVSSPPIAAPPSPSLPTLSSAPVSPKRSYVTRPSISSPARPGVFVRGQTPVASPAEGEGEGGGMSARERLGWRPKGEAGSDNGGVTESRGGPNRAAALGRISAASTAGEAGRQARKGPVLLDTNRKAGSEDGRGGGEGARGAAGRGGRLSGRTKEDGEGEAEGARRGGMRGKKRTTGEDARGNRRASRATRKAAREEAAKAAAPVKAEILEVGKEGLSVEDLASELAVNDSDVVRVLFMKVGEGL